MKTRILRVAAVLALLAMLTPAEVQAAPRCPGGGVPNGYGQCSYRVDRLSTGYWPMLIDGERVTVGVRQGVRP